VLASTVFTTLLNNTKSSGAGYFRGYVVLINFGILQIRIFKHKKYVHLKNKHETISSKCKNIINQWINKNHYSGQRRNKECSVVNI